MLDQFVTGWVAWWNSLTPEYAFLLALPFVVVAAAFAGDLWRKAKRTDRTDH